MAANGGSLFNGSLAELRIYARALSTAEIASLSQPLISASASTPDSAAAIAVPVVLLLLGIAAATVAGFRRMRGRLMKLVSAADQIEAPAFAINFSAGIIIKHKRRGADKFCVCCIGSRQVLIQEAERLCVFLRTSCQNVQSGLFIQ